MEVGFSQVNSDNVTDGYNGSFVNMDFDYAPGFKVAMGGYFDYDNWDLNAEYTWFHTSQDKTAVAVDGVDTGIYPMSTPNFAELSSDYDEISNNWNLKMDIAELDLGRWYYVGTKLTFRPSFGVRGQWIRQDLKSTQTNIGETAYQVGKGKTRSWAVGPQVALDTNWMLGSGFRIYGCAEADAVFTKYTKANTSYTVYDTNLDVVPDDSFRFSQGRVYAVRTHLDLELGFGWGTYLDCNNWYMDFALGYGFQTFFDQNMFRKFTDDDTLASSFMPNGNLYLQGLTATFKLDF
jgi:hypothetical protein